MSYREQLLAAGFSEAKQRPLHFFLSVSEKTALVVNLEEDDGCTGVLFGCSSVAVMSGDENWVENNGVSDTDCTIRNYLVIASPEDEKKAYERISAFFREYGKLEKDNLLARKKERQKEFLARFTAELKPLGFKKKAAKWTRVLERGYELILEAQKSYYSDQYYFNVVIRRTDYGQINYNECFRKRVVRGGRDIFDWQLMASEQLDRFIDDLMRQMICPMLETPLSLLGKQDDVCKGCGCRRNQCPKCWVDHNLWGN